MDDDVIDISNISDEVFRTHLRRLADITSCPCMTCVRVCDRPEFIDQCDAYQLWRGQRMEARKSYGNESKI